MQHRMLHSLTALAKDRQRMRELLRWEGQARDGASRRVEHRLTAVRIRRTAADGMEAMQRIPPPPGIRQLQKASTSDNERLLLSAALLEMERHEYNSACRIDERIET